MWRWLLNSAVPLILAAGGTAALLHSWDYEKSELARASEEASRLQRSQLVIDTDEVARDQWIIALNQELTKAAPNPALLATAAHGAVVNLVRWQSHMEMRVAGSPAETASEIAAREAIIAQSQKLADAKDYPTLVGMLQKFTQMSRTQNVTSNLDQMFFARIDEANARIAEIEGAMRFWYLAGTAMLLFSSVLASILMDKSLRRIENQITGTKGGRRGSRGSSAKEQTGKE